VTRTSVQIGVDQEEDELYNTEKVLYEKELFRYEMARTSVQKREEQESLIFGGLQGGISKEVLYKKVACREQLLYKKVLSRPNFRTKRNKNRSEKKKFKNPVIMRVSRITKRNFRTDWRRFPGKICTKRSRYERIKRIAENSTS
jgi:hypothetical protein